MPALGSAPAAVTSQLSIQVLEALAQTHTPSIHLTGPGRWSLDGYPGVGEMGRKTASMQGSGTGIANGDEDSQSSGSGLQRPWF